MEKKQTKTTRLFYMYYNRGNGLERSPEFKSFAEFYSACGKWCNAHPEDWRLCTRDVRETVE